MDSSQLYTEIRKLRKKLRQIENLQNAQRPLTTDEQIKVQKKDDLRLDLQEKLRHYKPVTTDAETASHDSAKNQTHSESDDPSRPVDNLNHKESEKNTVISPSGSKADSSSKRIAELRQGRQHQKHSNSEVAATGVTNNDAVVDMQKTAVAGSQNRVKTKSKSEGQERKTKGDVAVQDKGKKKSKPVPEELPREVNPWDKVRFSVTDLTGHNDIVCSVHCYKDLVVSGSRDTSIKVWDACSGHQIRSLGGHTDSVTTVELVPREECQRIATVYDVEEDVGFILSSSLDCTLRLWVLESGLLVKSIYTFNAIITMKYVRGRHLAVTGYTGGKVELWDILTGQSIFSAIGHEDAVTALEVSLDKVITASADGVIKVWELRDNSLHPVFVSENVKPVVPRMKLHVRKVHTLSESKNVIYYGDNGLNIKVLDWREGVIHKLRNHKEDSAYGFVDSIRVLSPSCRYLICSGYDLDMGNGYLNIFALEQEKYLATLMDHDASRIFTVATTTTQDGRTRLVTGGAELKVWEVIPSNCRNKDKVVTAFYNEAFSRRVVDSEDESDDESDSDEGDDEDERQQGWSGVDSELSEEASGSWCSIT